MTRYRSARRVVPILLGLALVILVTSCRQQHDWIRFRGEGGRGQTSDSATPPIGVRWKLELQANDGPAFAFNNPVIKGDTMYFGSTDGNFYALDMESGYMRWVFKTEAAVNSIPFADDQNVYFGSNDGRLYALSQTDGQELWRFDTGRPVQSTVLRHEDTIIFTSDGGATYFVSPQGVLIEEIVNPVWYRDTFQVFDGTIYLARGPMSNPHSLGAFHIDRREHLWVLETSVFNATWYSFPAIRGDLLYMSTTGYRGDYWEFTYYAFDRRTGQMVWSTGDASDWGTRPPERPRTLLIDTMKLLDYHAPAVWRDTVIFTSGDNIVRAFDARTGQREWEREFQYRTTSAPLVAGNRVYFGVAGDEAVDIPVQVGEVGEESGTPQLRSPRLVALSANTGRVIWEMEVEGAVLSAPIVSGKWIVFGTADNKVYVLERLIG